MLRKTTLVYVVFLSMSLTCLFSIAGLVQAATYDLDFSTYFGGSDWEHARDVFVDAQGNVYITGGTASSDFPTTPGAYDRTYNTGGSQIGSAGNCDAFVCKFDSNGSLIWSTYLGSPNYDRGYGIEVDTQGYVYIAGRAGPGFPVTSGAFQTNFQGVDAGIYSMQNGFVAKLSPDGSSLVWASYVGVGSANRDIAIDNNGDIYLPLRYENKGGTAPSQWFVNGFQKTPQGGNDDGVIKIKSDGTQVIWATYLGGSGDDGGTSSIRVDASGYVYIAGQTKSVDFPTTAGAYDNTYNGGVDFYIAKLTPDGSNLVWGTYLGDSGDNWLNTHNLAIDGQGNAYVSVTSNSGFPTTAGAFQTVYGGGNSDIAISKFDWATGALIASTFLGGSGGDNPDGIYVDASGNVFITGETGSTDFPVTSGTAYQSQNGGSHDAVVVMLSADFSQLLYSTYMGGGSYDMGRSGFLDHNGNLYITGSCNGSGWPTQNAYQASFAGGSGSDAQGGSYAGDCILAKFNISEPGLPTVAFSSVSSGGSEGVSPVALAVELSAASGQAVTVDYSVTGGTATGGGVDYTLASGTLTFSPGDTTENVQMIIVDDSLVEGSETVVVALSNPTNATLGANASHTYTINDNEAVPTVEFATTSSSGAETVSPATLAVNLSGASGQTVTVDYSVTGGTATGGGMDYTLASGTLTFSPGDTTENVQMIIVDDSLVEGSETVVVALSDPSNATLGAKTTHTYMINDNDVGPTAVVEFAAVSSSAPKTLAR